MTQIGIYTYEIDQSNAVRIWNTVSKENGEPPFLYQPFDTETGQVFSSFEEADSWSSNYIEKLIEAANMPPNPPEHPVINQPLLEE